MKREKEGLKPKVQRFPLRPARKWPKLQPGWKPKQIVRQEIRKEEPEVVCRCHNDTPVDAR